MKLVVAVTDGDWYEALRNRPHLDEVNFWAPNARPFRALLPGELFLFKLHAPRNYIVGGGIFAHATDMPCSLAWDAFQEANGASSLTEMRARIAKYRRSDPTTRENFIIGCRILTQPFFLSEFEWVPVPESWSRNTQVFKTYSTDDGDGLDLWDRFEAHAGGRLPPRGLAEGDRYGSPVLVQPRLGQGAFRLLVTDQYGRRCAVTGERTLPALEAAHIQPYAEGGAHEPTNGLLMRRDIHSLFDRGYVTVTPHLRFEVSRRIREEFENGRDYYRMHGYTVAEPMDERARPDPTRLRWHNENRFLG